MQISDCLMIKYEKLLYIKVFDNFLQIFAKKGLRSVLFSKDGRVTANTHIFFFLAWRK